MVMCNREVSSRRVSRARPRRPRSACEIALAETPANSASSSSGTPVDTVFGSVARLATQYFARTAFGRPEPGYPYCAVPRGMLAMEAGELLRASEGQSPVLQCSGSLAVGRHERGGDDAVLRGDLVDHRPQLGDLARTVDEHRVRGEVAGQRGDAVAERPLVAGEAPLAAQRRDARARLLAAVGGSGWCRAPRRRTCADARVYTRSAIHTGGSSSGSVTIGSGSS